MLHLQWLKSFTAFKLIKFLPRLKFTQNVTSTCVIVTDFSIQFVNFHIVFFCASNNIKVYFIKCRCYLMKFGGFNRGSTVRFYRVGLKFRFYFLFSLFFFCLFVILIGNGFMYVRRIVWYMTCGLLYIYLKCSVLITVMSQ